MKRFKIPRNTAGNATALRRALRNTPRQRTGQRAAIKRALAKTGQSVG